MEIIWGILIIPVGMWILTSVLRGGKADPQAEQKNLAQRDNRKQPANNDIDRFLAEINRRRLETAERQSAPPPEPIPLAQPLVEKPKRPRQVRTDPTPPRKPQRTVLQSESRPSVVPVVLELANDNSANRYAYATAEPSNEVSKVAAVGVAAKVTQRASSQAMLQIAPLLRSPQALRTAIILQEIFGKPRSLKPR